MVNLKSDFFFMSFFGLMLLFMVVMFLKLIIVYLFLRIGV